MSWEEEGEGVLGLRSGRGRGVGRVGRMRCG